MIINNLIEEILGSKSKIVVLRILNNRVVGISGRETARIAGISLRSAQLSLEYLNKLNIVRKQSGNRENLYTLNREHIVTKELVVKLFASERKIQKSLFEIISNYLNEFADSLIIFGSVTRNEETVDSDLDLCIVHSRNKSKIEKSVNILREELFDSYGIKLAPFYINKSNFQQKAAKKEPPLEDILKNGKLIAGESIKNLVNGKEVTFKKNKSFQGS